MRRVLRVGTRGLPDLRGQPEAELSRTRDAAEWGMAPVVQAVLGQASLTFSRGQIMTCSRRAVYSSTRCLADSAGTVSVLQQCCSVVVGSCEAVKGDFGALSRRGTDWCPACRGTGEHREPIGFTVRSIPEEVTEGPKGEGEAERGPVPNRPW